ncbi:MAG: hypothetical protein ACI9EW_003103 [Cellvibrionaceae bacterium]|jgi:hypothetical protein
MSEPITIRNLVDRVLAGDIRVPAFQRDFVWKANQIAFLLDSIYKGFPIGTVILWKTKEVLTSEKKLGFFELPAPREDYPVHYVLDGQQRLTSLFSVFQTELEPNSEEWLDIYFDLTAMENVQESLFVALYENEVDLKRHFPVKTLFDSVTYRRATEDLSDEQKIKVDEVQDKFKSYWVPHQTFETSDINKVAIVFERINRAGTELKIFELLAAWSWSGDFDLVDKFEDLEEKISEHGFEDLCRDRDLLLRICAGIISGKTSPKDILGLKGDEIRDRFLEIENGILGALDFLSRELGIKHFKMIPFPGLLVPLSAYFATDRSEGFSYSSKQKHVILKWFWRSLFSRRFSAGVNERQSTDIEYMISLKSDENFDFVFPSDDIKFDFAKSNFSAGNANSKSLILLLNSMEPYSLLSGAKVDLDKVLKKGSKHEYHHIFPKSYLEKLGKTRPEINSLANICFLTRYDNNTIKDKAPKIYGKHIEVSRRDDYLEKSLIPQNFDELNYDEFLVERTMRLELKALELME